MVAMKLARGPFELKTNKVIKWRADLKEWGVF